MAIFNSYVWHNQRVKHHILKPDFEWTLQIADFLFSKWVSNSSWLDVNTRNLGQAELHWLISLWIWWFSLWKQLLTFNSYETMVIWIYGGNTYGKRTIFNYQKVVSSPINLGARTFFRGENLRSKCQAADGDWGRPLDTAVLANMGTSKSSSTNIRGWVKTNSNHILGNEDPLERAIFREKLPNVSQGFDCPIHLYSAKGDSFGKQWIWDTPEEHPDWVC